MASFLCATRSVFLTILLIAKVDVAVALAVAAESNAVTADNLEFFSKSGRSLIDAFTIIAGSFQPSGAFMGDGSLATAARLYEPKQILFDKSGHLHFVDSLNCRIRRVDKDTGIITTVVGGGKRDFDGDNIEAIYAGISPDSFTYDVSGNMYICDIDNNRIRKVTTSTGIITTVAGNGTSGYNGDDIAASTALLQRPASITSDSSGNLYFIDTYYRRVRKITMSTGIITTVAGTGGYDDIRMSPINVPATSIGSYISSFEVDRKTGTLYINDYDRRLLLKITPSTGLYTEVYSNILTLEMFLYEGYMYHTFNLVGEIAKISLSTGEFTRVATNVYSHGIYVDTSGNMYVSEFRNHVIVKVALGDNLVSFPTKMPTLSPTPPVAVTAPPTTPPVTVTAPPTTPPVTVTAPPTTPPVTVTAPPTTPPVTVTAPPTRRTPMPSRRPRPRRPTCTPFKRPPRPPSRELIETN
jgi:hypothetical protein